MTNLTTTSAMTLVPSLEAAWRDMDSSFERFCLTAGIEALEQMLGEDAQRLAGPRHSRGRRARRPALGRDAGKDRLPRRQGRCATAAPAQLRRP